MSPSGVVATTASEPLGAGDAGVGNATQDGQSYGPVETGVAKRTMTVAVATTPTSSPPTWSQQERAMATQTSQQHEVFTSMDQPGYEGVQNGLVGDIDPEIGANVDSEAWSLLSGCGSSPASWTTMGAIANELTNATSHKTSSRLT